MAAKDKDGRYLIKTPYGVIDGIVDVLHWFSVEPPPLMPHHIKTNDPCCLKPINWEGYGTAFYVEPFPQDDPLYAVAAVIEAQHGGRCWTRACRCKRCGSRVSWAEEWVSQPQEG